MNIDLNQVLLNDNGKELQEKVGTELKSITLRQVLLGTLRSSLEGDAKLSFTEKENLFDLLMKLNKDQDVEFAAAEITVLQKRVQQMNYGILLCVQVCRLLDKKETGIVKEEEAADESKPTPE